MAAETKQVIDNEAQIRKLIDDMVAAEAAKDVEASVSPFAPDVVSYDVIEPLEYRGVEAIRKRLGQWFSSFEGPIGIEFRDLAVTAGRRRGFV